ncbi:hypothetical protein GGI11_005870 [Coemansia sp. RSA 2049]|nr:hypothetical protein GGI11_005870 [Coemansia sp. RSA 2049]KAJ2522555.1 hypothetical protein H4217_000660 [Coemansia sp. RSA 1939]KAJ2604196.1 hypothetical protein EV177_006487 [Coemansia sp. RSA 1804]KAJ2687693.1 hypothetical protein GGH99_003207 [Coemansia sp. RSA 1285]
MVRFASLLAAGALALGALVSGAPVDIGGAAQARRDYHEINTAYVAPSRPARAQQTVTVTVDRYINKLSGGGYTTMLTPPPDAEGDSDTPAPASTPQYATTTTAAASSSGGSYTNDWKQQMLVLVNQIRAGVGKPALTINDGLNQMAEAQSDYQASIATMTHSNPSGSLGARCSSYGIKWSGVAENVAWNYPDVAAVVQGWKDSPGHYANMIGDYNVVGFGVNNLYWTQDFAKI